MHARADSPSKRRVVIYDLISTFSTVRKACIHIKKDYAQTGVNDEQLWIVRWSGMTVL